MCALTFQELHTYTCAIHTNTFGNRVVVVAAVSYIIVLYSSLAGFCVLVRAVRPCGRADCMCAVFVYATLQKNV